MRKLFLAAVAVVAVLALGGVAQAGTTPPGDYTDPIAPPEFSPPAAGPVTDVPTAEAFTERYVSRQARRLVRQANRRIRVLDVNAACLQHPAIDTRWGCVFTLRAEVRNRDRRRGDHGDRGDRYEPAKKSSRRGHRRDRVRVRTYGCLGGLVVNGGPTVTPTGTVRFVECRRIRNGDYEAPEVEPVS